MVVDHIGIVFFSEFLFLRIAGRLSFPIFAFLIAEGYTHTRNINKYLQRLLIFFIISEPIYLYVFKPYYFEALNIFAYLFLGLLAIYTYDRISNKNYAIITVLLIALFPTILGFAGFFEVLFIFSFYLYPVKTQFKKLLFVQFILIILETININYSYFLLGANLDNQWLIIQFLFLSPLTLFVYYDKNCGSKLKYIFYIFYPLHILVIGLIKYFLINKPF